MMQSAPCMKWSLEVNKLNDSRLQPIIMAYVRRIKRGTITINDVPENIREDVQKIIEEG